MDLVSDLMSRCSSGRESLLGSGDSFASGPDMRVWAERG